GGPLSTFRVQKYKKFLIYANKILNLLEKKFSKYAIEILKVRYKKRNGYQRYPLLNKPYDIGLTLFYLLAGESVGMGCTTF
ncbi:MAG: hypothetical protein IJS82_01895, partial [Paludibacteraceae bacterium]|nr:hypothetical protein [Paludibacteraceae bacterium]